MIPSGSNHLYLNSHVKTNNIRKVLGFFVHKERNKARRNKAFDYSVLDRQAVRVQEYEFAVRSQNG